MIKVKTLHDLKSLPPSGEPVYVFSKKKIYVNQDGEWITRMYFRMDEVAGITGVPEWQVREISKKLGFRTRLTYLNLTDILKATKIKQQYFGLRYSKLKQIMRS